MAGSRRYTEQLRVVRRSTLTVVLCMVVAACGTNLTDEELGAANGSLTVERRSGADAAGAVAEAAEGTEALTSADASRDADVSSTGTDDGGGGRGVTAGGIGAAASTGSAAATAGGDGPGQAVGGPEIVLGSFGTSSGPIGAQLASIPVANRAWLADVNARGGINGRRVRIVFGDDGGDPGRALSIARRMVEQDHVIAFFGTYGATTIQAVVPYLESRGIPVIGSEGGNPIEDHSPMVFNPQVSADKGVARSFLTALVTQSDARKVALLYCGEAETCTNGARTIREYAPKIGVDIVYNAQVSLAQPDYTAEVIAARNAGATALLSYIDVASMVRIVRSAHRQGWRPAFGGGVAFNEEAIKQGGADVEGLIAPAATMPYMTSSRMADYRQAVARYVPGGLLGGTGASSWVAGKLLERIFQDIDGEPTSAKILDALHGLRNETLGWRVPPLTFNEGPHTAVNLCTVPLRFTGGRFVPSAGEKFVCGHDDGIREVVPG